MLFVLTGGVQTGKTRWLEQLACELERRGIVTLGVLAPGVWADRQGDEAHSEHVDANGFEKLGIDNVLLPDRRRIPFARRVDLAQCEGAYDATAQSAQAQLSWHISEEALGEVNAHLTGLARHAADDNPPSLLIIDELGRLELLRGGGLTGALDLLEGGPTPNMPHALVVVRESLLPHLETRFGKWGERKDIKPDDASAALVLDVF